jgi:predicted Rossmann fold nucleotide-binding protein DprA/Smf involved in DNA uptake
LVVEGPERSGALITARYATEQGKTVFAIPGNVGSKNSQLSNLLLKNGARICTSAEDILNSFADKYGKLINPFLLKERVMADMSSALIEYGVCAVCPSDDIFETPRKRRNRGDGANPLATVDEVTEPVEAKSPPSDFDSRALKIYKKIPLDDSCSIESLIDGENNLREVMKSLLKLEMGGFVKLLPGEMVSRKTN